MSEPWRPRRELDDVSELSESDVAARLGLEGPGEAAGTADAVGASTAVATSPLAGSAPRVTVRRSASRRRTLWWDSATIVGGVVAALVALQYFGAPQLGPVAVASPTADETGVITGSMPVPATLPPPETLGPVVDPSLGLDATPTPIPVITLGPTPKETPSPSPSPTPAPLAANFTWAQLTGTLRIRFTDASTGEIARWRWNFGDGTAITEFTTATNPAHTYASGGSYSVRLAIFDAAGVRSVKTITVTVIGPTPAPPSAPPPPTDTPAPTPTDTPEPTPSPSEEPSPPAT